MALQTNIPMVPLTVQLSVLSTAMLQTAMLTALPLALQRDLPMASMTA